MMKSTKTGKVQKNLNTGKNKEDVEMEMEEKVYDVTTSNIVSKNGLRLLNLVAVLDRGLGCIASNNYLTKATGLTISELHEVISSLADLGCISVTYNNKGRVIRNLTNDNRISITFEDFSKIIIKLYPGRKSKAIRDKKVPKLLDKYGADQLIRCLKRYAAYKKDTPKKYIHIEGRFWNTIYIDYLDCNYKEN